jgi:hypothetical protein
MIDKYESFVGRKEEQYLLRFIKNLWDALVRPKSFRDVVTWIDYVFLKLIRLIKIHSENYNAIEFQKKIFCDICKILNSFNDKFYVWNFHNSISKTSLEKYINMSLWEQFYDVAYGKIWDFDYNCNGWNCTKYTLSFYNFFDALRKVWLDLKISIFRLKNIDDVFLWMMSWRHSWLLINFQWEDYILDYKWINNDFSKTDSPVIQTVDWLLDSVKNREELKNIWVTDFSELDLLRINNLKKKNSRENWSDLIVYFDNVEAFLEDVKKYPCPQRISFVENYLEWGSMLYSYWFFRGWVFIETNEVEKFYYLKDDVQLKLENEDFLESFIENIGYCEDVSWNCFWLTIKDREMLLCLMNKIKYDICLDSLISMYIS